MLSQSTPSYFAALPVEHVRVLGTFGDRSNFVELFTRSSSWSNIEFWQF